MKIKVVNLSDKEKRIIYGELADQFDLDYSQELGKLKRDIEFALSVLEVANQTFCQEKCSCI